MNKKEREKFHKSVVGHYRKTRDASETAGHFEISAQTVRDVCKKAGVIFRHGKTDEEKSIDTTISIVYAILMTDCTDSEAAARFNAEDHEIAYIRESIRSCGFGIKFADLVNLADGTSDKEYVVMGSLLSGVSSAEIARQTGFGRDLVNRVRVRFKESDLWEKIKAKRKGVVSSRAMKPSTYAVIKMLVDEERNCDIAKKLGVAEKYVSKVKGLAKSAGLI